jgi:RHH-type proline utilization regulon transcriptional repressor/proline dehydrogenase/delta 1-pyrroline-5-carboxylate dehydrogenase
LGQDNFLKYIPHRYQTLRIQEKDTILDIFRAVAASLICHAPLEISCETNMFTFLQHPQITFIQESEEQLIRRINQGKVHRLRVFSTPSSGIINSMAEAAKTLLIEPVLANGRIELLSYLREVSVSTDYHRYGNLGIRETEKRRPLSSLSSSKKEACGTACTCFPVSKEE